MSATQKQGLIVTIPKPDKARHYLKNWRPITLLTVDYKIASAVIAERLKKILPKVISPSHKGFLKGRYIGENTRFLYDLMKITEEKSIPWLLLLIDFEKAFDTVEWSFIDKCLKYFNFVASLRSWIKTFYSSISSFYAAMVTFLNSLKYQEAFAKVILCPPTCF